MPLSLQAASVWGKSDCGENEYWLPLFVHMADSLSVAERLWDVWIPQGTRDIVVHGIGGDEALARRLCAFLAGVHDIGKATPIFQAQTRSFGGGEGLAWKPRKAGLLIRDEQMNGQSHLSHPIAGQVILNRYFQELYGWASNLLDSITCVVGGHHGRPPIKSDIRKAKKERTIELGWDEQFAGGWERAQLELIDFVSILSGFDRQAGATLSTSICPPMAESVLTGLVIMADWIASNTDYFPLLQLFPDKEDERVHSGKQVRLDMLEQRAGSGWEQLDITPAWHEPTGNHTGDYSVQQLFDNRFQLPEGSSIRPVQREAAHLAMANEDLGLMIIEAPMGEGKTEAALAVAEIMSKRTGRGGVCVALPTMATTDAMFGRVHDWLRHLPQEKNANEKSIFLAHGKARLNDEFQGISKAPKTSGFRGIGIDVDIDQGSRSDAQREDTVASQWMSGRKKGVLSNFLVCTVDQVLMGALSMKHLALRQLALANKVIIIDECHAYDIYMQQYLLRLLEWLGAFGSPVILLSATLPEDFREQMTQAYLSGRKTLASTPKSYKVEQYPIGRIHKQYHSRREPLAPQPKVQEPEIHTAVETVKAYPYITYTDGTEVMSQAIPVSGRASQVKVALMGDDDGSLVSLLKNALSDGGCAGVICDTVDRAQHTAQMLADHFGPDSITLTHARFMDVDRMHNETDLRSRLGPQAALANGQRPKQSIVVGTQVLEQSLDIDFDFMVTDIAPTDLIMQRLGRVHRHSRGVQESDRPVKLREARCFIRGIDTWKDGIPVFSLGVDSVYFPATLLEFLTVCRLDGQSSSVSLELPGDIARLVRAAYSPDVRGLVSETLLETYDHAVEDRLTKKSRKIARAKSYLLPSVAAMCKNDSSLDDWFDRPVETNGGDDDAGQRAVRDTEETVEVLLLCNDKDGKVHLMPWIDSGALDEGDGTSVPTEVPPSDNLAKVVVQCAVRLPLKMGRGPGLDTLIRELEDIDSKMVHAWQDSRWLAGQLVLFLDSGGDGVFTTKVHGFTLAYSQKLGLVVASDSNGKSTGNKLYNN